MHVPLHFAERAFALHLLLQRLERLVDVVVADKNLNQRSLSFGCPPLALAAWRSKNKTGASRRWAFGARRARYQKAPTLSMRDGAEKPV